MSIVRRGDTQHGDPLLRLFADRASRKGIEMEITLQVGGLLVAGYLTSAAAYCDRLDSQLSEGLARLDPSFQADQGAEQAAEADLNAANEPEFIHLRDAYICGPDGAVVRSPAWRGRLASVDAFTLGIPDHLKQQETPATASGH